MLRYMLKSKLHRARVIEADLNYEGSLSIDKELMQQVDIRPYEKIKIYNINNGERFDTYAIEGKAGSKMIGLNGAAARKGLVGDRIIIVSYALFPEADLDNYQPNIVVLDENNTVIKRVSGSGPTRSPGK